MCLILFSFKTVKSFPLILAANRDEFHTRPTAPMDFWEGFPSILAGRDLEQGGTWLGVHLRGRFAALTNFRDPSRTKPDAPSRGSIIPEFLESRDSATDFLEALDRKAEQYNGFNLLTGEIRNKDIRLYWYSNRARNIVTISPGIHGVSNSLLDTEWPKVSRGKAMIETVLNPDRTNQIREEHCQPDDIALFSMLGNTRKPEDDELPDTGVGLEWERLLSPLFIQSPTYGTRSSTLLSITREGKFTITERTYSRDGVAQGPDRQFCFRSDPDMLAADSFV